MSDDERPLRRGWTTGTCSAAAAKAACAALITGDFPDPVEVTLPGGQRPSFALARTELRDNEAVAAVIKDAGDDPDVTHGAVMTATVRRGATGSGITFLAGPGVGTVTRPGLPMPPGEPSINPVPRRMIAQAIAEIAGEEADFEVEISVPDGEKMALRTLNGRLGVVGGISVLGTTGVVVPYSCSAWIHSIHRGIDVARAAGLDHVSGATGAVSEAAAQKYHGLPELALIDMGDFVGGMLKYLRVHPVPRVTVAGGVAKMTKLAQGMLDVHSARGAADLTALAEMALGIGADGDVAERIGTANNVAEAFEIARSSDIALGEVVAEKAWLTAASVLRDAEIELEILVFNRFGELAGRAPFRRHGAPRPLNRL
ncbi:MAG: cobalt-precorrin-5B (C(1))-methyltransferase [Rhizobiaceae bacterium]|nr:cobalt-precorrin-5B (C(1))-methyltransferase [Rhizobiaceae bacterium]